MYNFVDFFIGIIQPHLQVLNTLPKSSAKSIKKKNTGKLFLFWDLAELKRHCNMNMLSFVENIFSLKTAFMYDEVLC